MLCFEINAINIMLFRDFNIYINVIYIYIYIYIY